MERLSMKRDSEAGFTLVELIVVILVISILSSIAYLGFNGINRASRVNSCKVDWATVNNAAIAYKNDNPSNVLNNLDLYSKTGEGSLYSLGYLTPLIDNKRYYTIYLTFDTTTKNPIISVSANSVALTSSDANKPENACLKI
jgi:prepilin-type N-terminal cleavage/methylation domain-containing protein